MADFMPIHTRTLGQESCVCASGHANQCMCTGELITLGDMILNRLVDISRETPCLACGEGQADVRWRGSDVQGNAFVVSPTTNGTSLGLDVTEQGHLVVCEPVRYIRLGLSGLLLSCQGLMTTESEKIYADGKFFFKNASK